MQKLVALVLMAVAAAMLLAVTASREPFAARVIRLEAAAAVPEMASALEHEPVALNAILLEYAQTPALRLNAHLALLRYPQMTRAILPLYGNAPEFREVFERHGPAVLPPIAYFMEHEIRSLGFMRAAGAALAGVKRAALNLFGAADAGDTGRPVVAEAPTAAEAPGDAGLTPVERGWFAIGFIGKESYDFLGQFVVDNAGVVQWVQTERITEAASEFFSGGIRDLESLYRRDEQPGVADFLWAGLDVALAAGAVKVLRAGRAAGAGAQASARAAVTARASAGSVLTLGNVVRGGRLALRTGRYVLPVAVAYAVVRHPSLISGLAAQAANLLGWPVALVQAAAWFMVLLPALLVVDRVLVWLVRPGLFVARAATRALVRLQREARRARRTDRTAPSERIEPRIGKVPRLGEPPKIHH